MAEDVERVLSRSIISDQDTVPHEFFLYRFCEKFHCLPEDVERMDAATFALFAYFMEADANASETKRLMNS